jgi:hypothetical protein
MADPRIAAYLDGAQQLRRVVSGMTHEQILARPIAGKWSTLEVVCHLADMDTVYAERIKRVIVEENPPLANADENRYAEVLSYHARDLDTELAVIEATRRQVATILENQPATVWERTGVHSELGPIALSELARRITNHVPHHVATIEEKRRALGI